MTPVLAIRWLATVVGIQGAVLSALLLTGSGFGGAGDLDHHLAVYTRPITIGVGLCALPGLVGLLAIRSLAGDGARWREPGLAQVKLLLRLRRELRRLLALLGALLTLIVVATGQRRHAILIVRPDADAPIESVVLYGLVFAVLLGLFFALASMALERRAQTLTDDLHPLPDPTREDMSPLLKRRDDFAALVGSGGSWRTFETTVVIVAPLLSALVAGATR